MQLAQWPSLNATCRRSAAVMFKLSAPVLDSACALQYSLPIVRSGVTSIDRRVLGIAKAARHLRTVQSVPLLQVGSVLLQGMWLGGSASDFWSGCIRFEPWPRH